MTTLLRSFGRLCLVACVAALLPPAQIPASGNEGSATTDAHVTGVEYTYRLVKALTGGSPTAAGSSSP